MNQLPAENLTITISLSADNHRLARQFAVEQNNNQKAKQVYLNTLAILAVKNFLAEISYPTDLERGDSWNSAVRCFKDAADLFVTYLGKIECRFLLPQQKTCFIPKEIKQEPRIAYVLVQFQEQLDRVELLGFIGAIEPLSSKQEISIQELEPIDNLIDYLYRLEIATEELAADSKILSFLDGQRRVQVLAEIIAQFDRIFKTIQPEEQIKKGAVIIKLWLEVTDEGSKAEKLSQTISDRLRNIWQIEKSEKKAIETVEKWSLVKWLTAGIDELALTYGWSMRSLEFDPTLVAARSSSSTPEKIQNLLIRQLKIAGQNYELQILPQNIDTSESTWRFKLRNLSLGGFIPGGFKLKLLTEKGEDFEGNEDVATTATEELYIDVTLESGEGLIWVIEPLPENYNQEILYFK